MEEQLFLRPATLDDINVLFEWVNEPAVRQNSFNTAIINFEEHESWYKNALSKDTTQIFILMKDGQPIGQIRLTAKGQAWDIDYSVDVNYRGNGYGGRLFELVEQELQKGTELVGEVKSSNVASQKVFERQGYQRMANSGEDYYTYIKKVGAK
ncbi:hypothetical protein NZ47_03435 [Anaerovibrio lipolyticus]|uniref:N-acetyltransferase domain-containing protein n=1 Tax=Anaerovibrio lipolyticus TaxID=82374 RepID=A0A0B2JWG8_9FIRM|nr:GNAT family N-acetyltransferase [Anaerovibrio lipolyticus]KHM52665.1 hypothetical protein NZ47_03435 [Anaerovibrio lipolyticus]